MSIVDNDPAVNTLLEAMESRQMDLTFLGRRGQSREYEVWIYNDYDDSLCTLRVVHNGLYDDNCLDGLPSQVNDQWVMYNTKELSEKLFAMGFNRWY